MRCLRGAGLGLLLLSATSRAQAWLWPASVKRQESELQASDTDRRRTALERSDGLSGEAAQLHLQTALSAPEPAVRIAALQAMLRRGQCPSLWSEDWRQGGIAERRLVTELLSVCPNRSAEAALLRGLSEPDEEMRRLSARALGRLSASDVGWPLATRLTDASPRVREAVVDALADLADPRQLPSLLAATGDSDPGVRAAALAAVGQLAPERAESALTLGLSDSSAVVRQSAIREAQFVDSPKLSRALGELLTESLTVETARALGLALLAQSQPEAHRVLLRHLTDAAPEGPLLKGLLLACAERGGALGNLWRDCLLGHSEFSPSRCAAALPDGHPFGAELLDSLEHARVEPVSGLLALGRCARGQGVARILAGLRATEAPVRLAAERAMLGRVSRGEPSYGLLEPLLEAYYATSGRVTPDGFELLSASDSPRAVGALVLMATGVQRQGAISALGQSRSGARLAPLLNLLDAQQRSSAELAARSLAERPLAGALEPTRHAWLRSERRPELWLLALEGAASLEPQAAVLLALPGARSGGQPFARASWLEALARSPHPEVQSLLAGAIAGPVQERRLVARALHARSPWWQSLLRDPDADVRAVACLGLSATTGQGLALRLRDCASDAALPVARNAATAAALWLLRSQGVPPVSDQSPPANIAAITASAVTELCRELEDARAPMRASALAALEVTRAGCESPLLGPRLLAEPELELRMAALGWLTARESELQAQLSVARAARPSPATALSVGPARSAESLRAELTALRRLVSLLSRRERRGSGEPREVRRLDKRASELRELSWGPRLVPAPAATGSSGHLVTMRLEGALELSTVSDPRGLVFLPSVPRSWRAELDERPVR